MPGAYGRKMLKELGALWLFLGADPGDSRNQTAWYICVGTICRKQYFQDMEPEICDHVEILDCLIHIALFSAIKALTHGSTGQSMDMCLNPSDVLPYLRYDFCDTMLHIIVSFINPAVSFSCQLGQRNQS